MNNSEEFCLTWNEFEAIIRESFRELRVEQRHFDVTLATDDGHQIKAHKIILSAGSKFFKEILREANHPNPYIYLKGVKRLDLENVIKFLYHGEANIAQEELNNFLETAQELQVKGLQTSDQAEIDKNKTLKSYANVKPELSEKTAVRKKIPIQHAIYNSLDKLEDSFITNTSNEVALVKSEEGNIVFNTNHELDLQIEQMIEHKEEMWHCKVCRKISSRRSNLQKHAETHIQGVSHSCHICNKSCSNRESLRKHISDYHCDLIFSCNVCGKSGMSRVAFKFHKSVHKQK